MVLSLIPAVVTGLIRAEHVEVGAAAELLHRLELRGVAVAALALRSWRRNELEGICAALSLLLVAGLVGGVARTGHFGGKLVFGESYLPF